MQPFSSGMIISINAATKVVTLLKQYIIPNSRILTTSQGGTQIIENENVYMGWGSQPFMPEFTLYWNCIMLAQFGTKPSALAMSYRSFQIPRLLKHGFGLPDSTPALWTYANVTSGPTVFYTSWNGATEIAEWRFFGAGSEDEVFTPLRSAKRTGFETTFVANAFYPWGYFGALASNRHVMGKSAVKQTYVPSLNVSVTYLSKPRWR
jgi:hypothetical protein